MSMYEYDIPNLFDFVSLAPGGSMSKLVDSPAHNSDLIIFSLSPLRLHTLLIDFNDDI